MEWSSKGVRQSVIAKRLDVSVRTVEDDLRAIRGSMAAGPSAELPSKSFADTLAELEAECKKLLKGKRSGPRVKASLLSLLVGIEKLKAERAPTGPSEVKYTVGFLDSCVTNHTCPACGNKCAPYKPSTKTATEPIEPSSVTEGPEEAETDSEVLSRDEDSE